MPASPLRALLFCLALLLAAAAPADADAQGAVAPMDQPMEDASDKANSAFDHATRSGILPVPASLSLLQGEERTPSEDQISHGGAGSRDCVMYPRPGPQGTSGFPGLPISRLSLFCVQRC